LSSCKAALAYRSYEEFDMVANVLGVAAGWMVAQASGPRVFARIERLIGV
jgi:hypothetical protein